MKKNALLFLVGIFWISSSLFAQSKCAEDVWMTLSMQQIPKALKIADECIQSNPNSADVWLTRANAYYQRFEQEKKLLEKNASYVVKNPDAIITANESFIKAQELNPDIKARQGMFDPKKGRIQCALDLYYKAEEEFSAGNYAKARDVLTASIKNFELENPTPELLQNKGIFYTRLSDINKVLKDTAGAKKAIVDGVKTNTSFPNIYLDLYDIYKAESDTANMLRTIRAAKRNVPDSMALDIYTYELDYYGIINNTEKMNSVRDVIFEKYGETVPTIIRVAAYLSNSGQFESAKSLIEKGLAIDPTNFDLNYQMAYLYYSISEQYKDASDKELNEGKYENLGKYSELRMEAVNKAHDSSEKAYQVNKNDQNNNILLQGLKVFLQKEVPAELEEKVKSYRAGN